MDFFEHQEQAKRSTTWLVVLFSLAVLGTVLAVNVIAIIVFNAMFKEGAAVWASPAVNGWATAGTLAVIGGSSLVKMAQLRGGGAAVAQMVGGRPLPDDPADGRGRKLRNVVEEMAIAAGCPVPGIWVLEDEPGINAFAAGRTVDDAVIGVTRGCVEHLTRDELQGVVAHEFSHILHGDMRLNVRLIGILAGILSIGMLGIGLLRSLSYTGGSTYRRSRKGEDGRGVLMMLAIGAALAVVGYVGVFFGRLIQSAISRQREYLADAAAVQFTRNPEGLAGALKKIAASQTRGAGSVVRSAHAGEVAHLFFASGFDTPLSRIVGSLFATHPPLSERIKRIEPGWDGNLGAVAAAAARQAGEAEPMSPMPGVASIQGPRLGPRSAFDIPSVRQAAATEITASAGQIMPPQVTWAGHFIEELPASLAEAARDPYAARAVIFALLLGGPDTPERGHQEAVLSRFDPPVLGEVRRLEADVRRVGAAGRLPLVEMTLPTLARLSELQAAHFARMLRELIAADRRFDVGEFALYNLVRRHVALAAGEGGSAVPRHLSVRPLMDPIVVVLSALAWHAGDEAARRQALSAGLGRLSGSATAAVPVEPDLDRVSLALERVAGGSAAVKRRVLDAAAHTVAADGVIGLEEGEMLRGVAAALDVPLPPMVA